MSVDLHAHTVPQSYLSALRAEVPELAPTVESQEGRWFLRYPSGRRSGPVPAGMFDTESRLEDMDAQDVTVQALSVPPTHFFYWAEPRMAAASARLHNDAMIEMARQHPDRFVVLATLPLQDTDASLAELERVASEPEVVGVEICTNVAGTGLERPEFAEVWTTLDGLGFPVVLHPDNVAGAERMRDHYLANFVGNPTDTTLAAGGLMFGGVLERCTDVRVVLLHGGGFLPYQIGRFDHGWRVRPEPKERLHRSPRELLERFYFDTLTHDDASLRFLLERVGPDRLVLGSDYPFDMADPDPARRVRRVVTDDAAAHAVLETTPRALITRSPLTV